MAPGCWSGRKSGCVGARRIQDQRVSQSRTRSRSRLRTSARSLLTCGSRLLCWPLQPGWVRSAPGGAAADAGLTRFRRHCCCGGRHQAAAPDEARLRTGPGEPAGESHLSGWVWVWVCVQAAGRPVFWEGGSGSAESVVTQWEGPLTTAAGALSEH